MTGHAVLVVGAGFSKPVGGPLLGQLLDPDYCVDSRSDPSAIECLRGLLVDARSSEPLGGPSLESVFSEVWEQQSTGQTLGRPPDVWDAGELLVQLQLHLGSVCGAIRFGHQISLRRLYREFFERLVNQSRSFTVVSFNYDLLVEEILDGLGTGYTYGPVRNVEFVDKSRGPVSARSEAIPLLKLHGSVNWGICRNCGQRGPGEDLVNAFEAAYFPAQRRARCAFCDKRFLEPGIVPPVAGKGAALRSFEDVWGKARGAIRRAREVIVVGYSLPVADRQAAALLREIPGPFKRPRVTVVCGPAGAPSTYQAAVGRFRDPRCFFEDYARAFVES